MQADGQGTGRHLIPRLLYTVQCRNKYHPSDNNLQWYNQYVAEFFAESSVMRYSVKELPPFPPPAAPIQSALSTTEVPYEALPQLLRLRYESGVQEEHLFLGNAIESPLPDGNTSIICYQAAEHIVFKGYTVVQQGNFKVVFNQDLKIQLLDFSITKMTVMLDFSTIQVDVGHMRHMLEEKCGQLVAAQQSGALDPQRLQEALLGTIASMAGVQRRLESYHKHMIDYTYKMLHFMQMSDVISTMDELFLACTALDISPVTALQTCNQRQAQVQMLARQGALSGQTQGAVDKDWAAACMVAQQQPMQAVQQPMTDNLMMQADIVAAAAAMAAARDAGMLGGPR